MSSSSLKAEAAIVKAETSNEIWNEAVDYLRSQPGLCHLLLDLEIRLQNVEDRLGVDPDTGEINTTEKEKP